ncbi:uncharacterized protein with NAD-binding domain and iron-sulfur cluster [Chitinivorax tropicus]|uniref:Uncharacterized protein with NAD-binding domain and iron-sulfur cluster n=1 Tax=Chitinivorax tropicus TaxID=714531 RepID=A0A840MMI2_9PROT|nr:NAD(P)-binding protein [Chitinivorax tropicus]MBB5017716.1 uncharacterized protein with NAD-binding domain and iron-sulfur cluster [Chitinivorax tropicus]
MTRPPYLYPPGSVNMRSPLALQQADMYGFFVKGELHKMQRMIDQTLNSVANGKMTFKVLSPYTMLTFTKVSHAHSDFPTDRAKGWITEADIVTWVMVGQMDAQNGKIEKLYWHPCHIWVDDCMALINGRELYGYPKYQCRYEMPSPNGDARRFSISTKAFKVFAPGTEIAWHPLLEVNAVGEPGTHRPIRDLLDLIEQAGDLLDAMPDFLDLDREGWSDIASLLMQPRVDQLFLKQFPDSSGLRAVYQAVVAAPAEVNTVHGGRLLGHQYQCILHVMDSFPLNETLGLKLGEQPALLPFEINFDFTVTEGEELVDNSCIEPEKIAILGGGVGSMTTAFFLTEQPGWQNHYDITVYQMGWRLGGKGASGRNAALGQRIEEHGLHIWFGFYENAFGMIRAAYDALDRPYGAPLRTWEDAFKPHNYIVLQEWVRNEWKSWQLDFPTLPGIPGDGDEQLTIWQVAVSMFGWIKKWLGQWRERHHTLARTLRQAPVEVKPGNWLKRLAAAVNREVHELLEDFGVFHDALHDFIASLPDLIDDHDDDQYDILRHALGTIRTWLEEAIDDVLEHDDELRRLYISLDLSVAVLSGMLEDGVFRRGFDVINDLDFRAWLLKHGANAAYSIDSAPVRGFYDLVFAYEDGDFERPNVEAGTMLRAMLRIAFLYKGGIMWKMQAGMGDVIFTPMYEVLKKRGVKFKFFHKVEELVPVAGEVGEIRLTRQVDLVRGEDQYDPFVWVKGLACWPSTPNYDQIMPEQADLLRTHQVNLESFWTDWPAVYQAQFGKPLPEITLKRGVDFDKVVFGISIGALPHLCPQLLAQSPALQQTATRVKTVVTQAYQLWLNQPLSALGWKDAPSGQQPVLSGFVEPYDTWASMDQLLVREDWPAGPDAPRNVAYFCSAMPVSQFPPRTDHDFPVRMAERAKQGALSQVRTQLHWLWPYSQIEGQFNWQWLTDPQQGQGEARFDRQYWRANVDPSEHYVLSVVGSSQYRLATDGAEFGNLLLTGDWIRTGLNAGCVEAAVMAGMQTARAISGFPREIKGEQDF